MSAQHLPKRAIVSGLYSVSDSRSPSEIVFSLRKCSRVSQQQLDQCLPRRSRNSLVDPSEKFLHILRERLAII